MPGNEGDWKYKAQVMFEFNSEEFLQELRSARANVQAAKAAVSTVEDVVKHQQSLAEQTPIDSLATGFPAQLLRNRPDVVVVEYAFRPPAWICTGPLAAGGIKPLMRSKSAEHPDE